ncbi:exported hypothetical protein [uncultured delta proteobacterium]|uniref:Uncharacterized protein n=1 Tax=uncultured delta proteobacterium TaxID=34034 RepID=A0A212K6S6_9DELT|nr:exported hypothetical protein [uncultured delta proteobacterium]
MRTAPQPRKVRRVSILMACTSMGSPYHIQIGGATLRDIERRAPRVPKNIFPDHEQRHTAVAICVLRSGHIITGGSP